MAEKKKANTAKQEDLAKGEERFVATSKSIVLLKPAYSKRKAQKSGVAKKGAK